MCNQCKAAISCTGVNALIMQDIKTNKNCLFGMEFREQSVPCNTATVAAASSTVISIHDSDIPV